MCLVKQQYFSSLVKNIAKHSIFFFNSHQYKRSAQRFSLLCALIFSNPLYSQEHSKVDDDQTTEIGGAVIGYSGMFNQVDYWIKLAKSLRREANERNSVLLNYTENIKPPKISYKEKLSIPQKAISDNVDGLILGSLSDETIHKVDILKETNIPLVLVNTDIEHPLVRSTVMTNNHLASTLAAEFLHEEIKRKQKTGVTVLIVTGDQGNVDARTRADSARRALSRLGGYNVQVLYAENWDGKNAFDITLEGLQEYGDDVAGIFSAFAPASIAATVAAESSNTEPVIMGFDCNIVMKKLIREEKLVGTVMQDTSLMGKKAVEVMFKLLEGLEVDRRVYIDPIILTKNTI